jgi:hypothetical protein
VDQIVEREVLKVAEKTQNSGQFSAVHKYQIQQYNLICGPQQLGLWKPGVVACPHNPSIQETEVGEL